MERLVSALAVTALTAGLLVAAPTASASLACPDPQYAIGGRVFLEHSIALGPLETDQVTWEAVARTACLAEHPASLSVATAARTLPLAPSSTRVDRETGTTTFRGTTTVDAGQLTNADAGEWLFTFAAGDVAASYAPVDVLRRTTLSFDAGPEPLRRHHRLTFRGVLRVADWERDRYRGLPDQTVRVFAIDHQTGPTRVPLVEPVTGRHGRYRVRATVAGPDHFQAAYPGTRGVDRATSRVDAVAARPTSS